MVSDIFVRLLRNSVNSIPLKSSKRFNLWPVKFKTITKIMLFRTGTFYSILCTCIAGKKPWLSYLPTQMPFPIGGGVTCRQSNLFNSTWKFDSRVTSPSSLKLLQICVHCSVFFVFVWMYNETFTVWLRGKQRVFFPLDLSVVLSFIPGTLRISEKPKSLSPVEPDY